jgi:NAD(P)-dependent dehydrogenase (short-subunit alcohol dehydrogenase family)
MTSSVLITGASSGLGLAASAELAAAGRHVILACRSAERGRTAAATVRKRIPDASVEVLGLDLASLASVRSAANELINGRPPLGAVVCNAGVQVLNGIRRSEDGYELTFATNHLGHFLLTELLLDHIARPGRIVLVSSGTHYGPWRSLGFPGPRWQHPCGLADPSGQDGSARAGRVRYSTSKLANLYAAYEWARRWASRKITVNAFDPGLMPQTRLDRDWPPRIQWLYGRLAPLVMCAVPGARSVDTSAADLAWLVTAPELADVTGSYFVGKRRRASSKESYDRARAAELWAVSEGLVAARS